MAQGAEQTINNRLSLDRFSCSLDKEDLRRFLTQLQERLQTAATIEIENFHQLNQTAEDFEKNKELLRSGFKIRPTVTGQNGQELYGTIETVFNSPNFPEVIKSVYINSEISLKSVYNYIPLNSFEIFLDFSRPEIFDFTITPSERTPNGSNIKVQGSDATWVNGLFHEIKDFIDNHKAQAPWLHQHSVYDILLWFIGYPIGFWACFKVSPLITTSGEAGPFLKAALYVYLFLIVLIGFRALFHYGRWVFPAIEFRYSNSKALRHRAILATLSIGLSVTVLYDAFKTIFLG